MFFVRPIWFELLINKEVKNEEGNIEKFIISKKGS